MEPGAETRAETVEERARLATVESGPGSRRAIAFVVLLVAGILSLPVIAAFLDGESTEDLIVPVQLAVMAAVGAIVGYLLPGIAGAGSGGARTAALGACIGVATALVGVAIFFLLLNG